MSHFPRTILPLGQMYNYNIAMKLYNIIILFHDRKKAIFCGSCNSINLKFERNPFITKVNLYMGEQHPVSQ